MKVRRVVFLLIALGVVIGVGVVYINATPQVSGIYPEPGRPFVPGGAPLKLTFSRKMKPGSVEEHLIIEPPIQGEFTWEENTLTFMPDQPWPSGETITVYLASGSQSAGIIPLALLGSQDWSFTIGRPLVTYLWPAYGAAELYTLDPFSGEVSQITSSPFGILDFDINADGTIIYYSARNSTGGSNLYAYDRFFETSQDDQTPILACPNAFCRSPKISPDGRMLAYERNPLPGSGASLYPQVWIEPLDGSTTRVEYLAGNPDHPTRLPDWSSEGLLSFYDITDSAYIFLDPITNETITLPNDTGEAGSWSPNGNAFVAPEIIFTADENLENPDTADEVAPSHLHVFDLPTTTSQDLSIQYSVEDTSPVYSPGGNYLAFARKYLDPTLWTPGRQLWIMRSDGREAHELTTAPYFNHFNFAWSPDSQQIVYLRFNQDNPTAPPEIWLLNIDGGIPIQLVIGGYAPQWIP